MRNHRVGGAGPSRLRVLLADECQVVRQAMRKRLEQLQLVEVIGETGRSPEALELFFRLRPQLVVVSVCLPGQGGFELLRSIKQATPDCAVILTTSWPEPFVAEIGRLLGAAAVCSAKSGLNQLCEFIQRLVQEQTEEQA